MESIEEKLASRKQIKGEVVVAMDTDPRTIVRIKKEVISATAWQKPPP